MSAGCFDCDIVPNSWSYTISGVTNDTCESCGSLNDTYTVAYDPSTTGCRWTEGIAFARFSELTFDGSTWTLNITSISCCNTPACCSWPVTATYSGSGSSDCCSPLTLTLGATLDHCSGWPATITITPECDPPGCSPPYVNPGTADCACWNCNCCPPPCCYQVTVTFSVVGNCLVPVLNQSGVPLQTQQCVPIVQSVESNCSLTVTLAPGATGGICCIEFLDGGTVFRAVGDGTVTATVDNINGITYAPTINGGTSPVSVADGDTLTVGITNGAGSGCVCTQSSSANPCGLMMRLARLKGNNKLMLNRRAIVEKIFRKRYSLTIK